MNQKHPIIPPPAELVQQWWGNVPAGSLTKLAATAAQWGADQELDACCEWFVRDWTDAETADALRNTRRPKPPMSLKEQALARLEDIEYEIGTSNYDTIRRALEVLPND